MRTAIHYSRKGDSQGYHVVDTITGELLARFASGTYERYRAERFQLQLEHPYVLRLADRIVAKYPELRKRALKAAMLYVEGHVRLNGAEHVFDVRSKCEMTKSDRPTQTNSIRGCNFVFKLSFIIITE